MLLHANCKINLGLEVLRRRADGYHDIDTVMLPVRGLYDDLEVVRTAGGVSFSATGLAVDCAPEQNSCIRAFETMRARFGIDGVAIRLHKRIPFGAGLGGGSSDATAVLLALDELFALHLPQTELIDLAAALGSDTAFFVRSTPQHCTGRGEIMEPFPLDLSGLHIVLIKPADNISTREAYAGIEPHIPAVPLTERLSAPIAQWQSTVGNDFERSVFAAHPAIGVAKARLLQGGAIYASMSGSGSTVYGLFDDETLATAFRTETPFIYPL